MKKFTLLSTLLILAVFASAQIVYPVVKSSGFETTDGFPDTFSKTGQAAWGLSAPADWWNLIFSNGTVKTHNVSTSTTEANQGTQSIKITVTSTSIDGGNLRLRTNTGLIPQNITNWDNYVVTLYAKTEGADKQIFKSNTQLATTSWQKFTFNSSYATSVNVTQFSLDFFQQIPNVDYVVYIDDFKIESTIIPVTSPATTIYSNRFTANWNSVSGATSYSLAVQQEDTPGSGTYSGITGSPFSIGDGSTISYEVTGLTRNTNYRYKVSASDGTITTPDSGWQLVLTDLGTDVFNNQIVPVYTKDGSIFVTTSANKNIDVYSATGQKLVSVKSSNGMNIIPVNVKGMVIVKVENDISKLVL